MRTYLRTTALAAALSLPGLITSVGPARAYQIDCAILLCLAGGWPSSAPCAAAWAEFIRRITPFPIEPPLQIWRCPMGVSMEVTPRMSPMSPVFEIAFRDEAVRGVFVQGETLMPVQAQLGADVDISGSAFDFVRSIRVFHVEYSQFEGRENCIISDATRVGTYGPQGDYHWARASVARVPAASALSVPAGCGSYAFRSVFVDWRDHQGTYGFEEVRY